MLSLLGGICWFYIIFEGRLLIFYRNIFKNYFKFNLSGSWEFAGQMCAALLLDAVSQVCFFFFFFLISAHCFFLPLPFPPSLAWLTDFSSHRFNPSQAPRPIPTWGIDIEYIPSDDLGHSAQCWSLHSKVVPWVIIVSSLAIAWCPNDESSEPMFFNTSSSLGFSSWVLQDCW